MNPTKIPKVGIPKVGIPKTGIPKTGIPKLGIPKVGKTPHWDSPQDRDSKARDSEVRDSENRNSENSRERKMRTKFFCTNFLNTARGPGHPGKIPGTSRIPLFETQGRQSFEGGHEVFGHHPFAWKTPAPPGGLWTQKLNLCALFSCLKQGFRS